jgi:hypothetical protein
MMLFVQLSFNTPNHISVIIFYNNYFSIFDHQEVHHLIIKIFTELICLDLAKNFMSSNFIDYSFDFDLRVVRILRPRTFRPSEDLGAYFGGAKFGQPT